MPIELTHDSTARELTTDQGVLRYHEAGEGPPPLPTRTIRDVEVHVFPDSGHWVMIEQKAAWEGTVLSFLIRKDHA